MGDRLSEYLRARTTECFRACVDENKSHIYSLARRILGDASLAEDVTQEVFSKVATARWDPDQIRSGKAFLSQITINIARSRFRTRFRQRTRELGIEAASLEPAQTLDADQVLDVREAVERLPRELRLWIELKFYCDLTPGEISACLGISKRLAQSRLTHAYARLRKSLGARSGVPLVASLLALRPKTYGLSQRLEVRFRRLIEVHSLRVARRAVRRTTVAAVSLSLALVATLSAVSLVLGRRETAPQARTEPSARGEPRLASSGKRSRSTLARSWKETFEKLKARLEEVDWTAIREQVAGFAVEESDVGEIRVVDEAGTPLRRGLVYLSAPMAAPPESALRPGVVSRASGISKQVLRGELANANPLTFPVNAEVLGTPLKLLVAVEGYPQVENRNVVLAHGRTEIHVTVPSLRRCTVRLVHSHLESPVADALVTVSPAVEADGTLRDAPRITARETEPGVYELQGHDGGVYDLSVTSPSTFPILREALELPETLQLWAHPNQDRTGNAIVRVFGPDEKPWPRTTVTARVGSKVFTRETDSEGLCGFDALPPATFVFRLAEGESVKWGREGVVECPRLVRPGRDVHVTLGKPRSDASLRLEVVNASGEPYPSVAIRLEGELYWSTVTDALGAADFQRLAVGEYRIGLRGPALPQGTHWASEDVVQAESGVERRVRLELGSRTIRGRVVAGSTAGFKILGNQGSLIGVAEIDSEGRFQLTHAMPGVHSVSLVGEQRGFVYRRALKVEVPPDGDPPPVEFRLAGLGVLWVEVTDAEGMPIRAGRIQCFGREGKVPLPRRSTGARGVELGALVEPGAYRIEVTTEAGGRAVQSLVVDPGEEERVEISVGQ